MVEDSVRTNEKRLKDYKGYEIWKIEDFDIFDHKISTLYEVADEDDAIDFFKTLAEAKRYIDTILA